jgi:translocation and assembly module TamA
MRRLTDTFGFRKIRAWILLWLLLAPPAGTAPASAAADQPEPAARLIIEGLHDHPALEANVRAMIPEIRLACDAPRVRLRAYLRQARDRAASALRALGHFNPAIETRIIPDGECRQPVLTIDPGPATVLDRVDVQIRGPFQEDPGARRFLEALPLEVGQTLHQGRYDETRDGLINLARSSGYLDAAFSRRRLWVDPAAGIARVELEMGSGPRYRFGALKAEQDILDPDFFDRLLPAAPGDPYTSDRLAQIGASLSASGYFADVRVRPDLEARNNGAVPINLLLTPRPRTGYELRLGYGTDTGPRVRAEVQRRRVNARGHKWHAGIAAAQRQQTLESVYAIPLARPLTDSLDAYARANREDNNAIVSQSGTLGVQWTELRAGWTRSLFTEYLYERTRYGREPAQGDGFLLGGLKLGRRVLDDPLFPTRGHSLDLILRGAAEPLLSATSLIQGKLRAMASRPWRGFILQARAELGATAADQYPRLPKSLRFFAGGDNSVRGYGYESLAPANDRGQTIGGRYLTTVSVEAMHPVYAEDWFGALFVDSGNAYDHRTEMDLKTGVGIGLRWRSPIGMVRLDLAQPLDPDGASPRLHIGIGADF